MESQESHLIKEPQLDWGGHWTIKKLDAFAKYVWSYLTIMKKNPYWKTIYFDGFAGNGTRKKEKSELFHQLQLSFEDETVYKGSAERVLNMRDNLSFDYYYFIDTNGDSIHKLENKLRSLKISAGRNLRFLTGDANDWLRDLAQLMNSGQYASLVLLDPFGMQIDWESIEALRGTRTDIWILIPTGVIVNRLLDRKGELTHINKLRTFFGLEEQQIRDYFYETDIVPTLFGQDELTSKVMRPIEKIADLYLKRINSVWDFILKKPLRLVNSRGVPIFHFVFASNNKVAVKIANQIVESI